MTEYTQYYNKITNEGTILETRTNFFIIWKNPMGTIRAEYFDGDGNFEGWEIIS